MFLEWDIDRANDHLLKITAQNLDKTRDCLKFLLIRLDLIEEQSEEQELILEDVQSKSEEDEQYINDLEQQVMKLKNTIMDKNEEYRSLKSKYENKT